MKRLPLLAIIMGIASPFPAIVCTAALLFYPSDRPLPGLTMALVAYLALMLAFSGAVHWGLALDRPAVVTASPTTRTDNRRMLTGGVPLPVGWLAILATFLGHAGAGLAILLAGFAGLFLAERAAWRRGELPSGYLALRLCMTAVIMTCLAVALLARAI
ncbi:DUF3429 domain-containing protein [Gluconacetobacter diazotrophicus]|uniref:DUF3429 domain-containing protein n=1 Tax=Gluconacetobacter diazotrophicus TaxID=33996 RepID=A0A7W4FEY1_GLUDI|nr:DUF3429 domain-containing protein [Gluconacetobacter diazotrophicus]MBB2156501.1 DUF3429 domain-containing protein [Gluconacetobacter diazotrophicus]